MTDNTKEKPLIGCPSESQYNKFIELNTNIDIDIRGPSGKSWKHIKKKGD